MKIFAIKTINYESNNNNKKLKNPAFGDYWVNTYKYAKQQRNAAKKAARADFFEGIKKEFKPITDKIAEMVRKHRFNSELKSLRAIKSEAASKGIILKVGHDKLQEHIMSALKLSKGNPKQEQKLYNFALSQLQGSNFESVDVTCLYFHVIKQLFNNSKRIDGENLASIFRRFETENNPIKKAVYAQLTAMNDSAGSSDKYFSQIQNYVKTTPELHQSDWAKYYLG